MSTLSRLRIRDEEHRALQGLLPPALARQAAQLNVASREAGGERIITAARVGELGVESIRRVVTLGDPRKVTLALTRELLTRGAGGPERER